MKTIFLLAFALILHVAPAESANKPSVEITTDADYRYIQSNGIPAHEHGVFPNRGNPNAISPQKHEFRMLLNPVRAINTTLLENKMYFGVALNGVPFDPGTAEYYYNDPTSGWKYEALSGQIDLGIDFNNAHVQRDGSYHYHGIPKSLVGSYRIKEHSKIIGYAADGFPIYAVAGYKDPDDPGKGIQGIRSSYIVKKGFRPTGPGGKYDGSFIQDYVYFNKSGDLDECNGRFGKTPDYPEGIYHYYLTDSFPFIPRCFRGEPDTSFLKSRIQSQSSEAVGAERGFKPPVERPAGQPQRGSGPPREAVNACTAQRNGSTCEFMVPRRGIIRGVCRNVQGRTACVPSHHRP